MMMRSFLLKGAILLLMSLTSCLGSQLDVNDPAKYCWELSSQGEVMMYVWGAGSNVQFIIDDFKVNQHIYLTPNKTNVKSVSECNYLNQQVSTSNKLIDADYTRNRQADKAK